MGTLRTALVVLLVALLAVDLAAANALVAAERTVLDPGFVTTTLEEESAYEDLESVVIDQLSEGQLGGTDEEAAPLPVDPEAVLAEAVDAEYVRSQLEPNIERTYAYLHGGRDDLELVIDLAPAKAAIGDAVEEQLTEASPTELVGALASETNDTSLEAGGTTLDLMTVGEMVEDESVFRAEREALREEVRDRVLTEAVDQAFAEASNDELLALVIDDYDPDAYTEQEKEQLVDDHEAEIRAAIRDRIEAERGDEIDAAVDDRLAETRQTVRSEIRSEFDESSGELPPALQEPVRDLLLVAVDGYLADVSHDEFRTAFEAESDDLAAGIATVVETQLDEEVPDQVDLTEDMDQQALRDLEQARGVVGLMDLLSVVLPLVALGLIGLVYAATRAVDTTAIGAGVGLTVGGLPVLVGSASLPDLLRDALAGGGLPATFRELLLAIGGQVANAVLLQSALVVGLGVVLLAGGLALRYGVVELPAGAGGD